MNLSIVIPAHNEERRIGRTLEAYGEFYKEKFKDKVEILVILNGCSDNTLGVVSNFSKKYKIIKYYNYPEKIGKGGAIIEGFKKAKGDLIGFVDADMATSPESFYDLVEKIGDYDGIIASRWVKGAIITKKQQASRLIASRVFNFLVGMLFDMNYRDTQCGAKLFKKQAIESIKDELGIAKYTLDVDILYRLKLKGYRVVEIPTVWHDQEQSKLVLKNTVFNMFFSIIRIRLQYSRFKFILNAYDKIWRFYFGK